MERTERSKLQKIQNNGIYLCFKDKRKMMIYFYF